MLVRRSALCLILLACAAPQPAAEERAESMLAECVVPEADWAFAKLGPVTGLPEPAASGEGILSPAVLEHEGVLHLWYTEKRGTQHALFHTESRDGGASFAAPAIVTGLGEGRVTAYPSVWRAGGAFHLLFGSGSVRHATSTDGVSFTLAPSSVLSASFVTERFDALSVLYPNRVQGPSGAVLFFSGYDGRNIRIGRAVEQEGRFAVDPPRPVIDLGASTDFDNAAVASPHVQYAFGRWWMWYGGYDTSATNPGPYRLGTASSADGITWQKHGVAVPLSPSGTDAWSTRDAALVANATGWTMFYVGLGDDGRYRLHRAASGVCSPR